MPARRPQARGRTWLPSLTHYDLADLDSYQNTGARVFPATRARARVFTSADVLGSGDCWCGTTGWHDWPGKAQGAPHPR